MHKPHRNQSGFTIIETIVASVVIFIAVLSTAVIFQHIGHARMRSLYISSITAIEAALTTALLDESYYRSNPALRAALHSGGVPAGLTYNVKGESSGQAFDFQVGVGAANAASVSSRTLQTCTGFPSTACDLRLTLEVQNTSGHVVFAYKFEHHVQPGKPLLNFFGTGSTKASGFDSEDFSLPLPHEFLYDGLLLACPAGSLGVRGVDRSGGAVNCISQPQLACPSNTLGKSVRYEPSTGSVEIDCSAPVQTVSCPDKYALESINTASLDAGAAKNARCVYQNARQVTGATLGPAYSISQHVCPADYRSTSTCTLTNIQSTQGQCPDVCTDTDADGTCIEWTTPPPNNPVAGSAVLNEDSAGNATCYVSSPSQQCGATWSAQVVLGIRCTISVPEYVNAN